MNKSSTSQEQVMNKSWIRHEQVVKKIALQVETTYLQLEIAMDEQVMKESRLPSNEQAVNKS